MKMLSFSLTLLLCLFCHGADDQALSAKVAIRSGTMNIPVREVVEVAAKNFEQKYPKLKWEDYSRTMIIHQDKPVLQLSLFKGFGQDAFIYEIKLQNGKPSIIKVTKGLAVEPESPLKDPVAKELRYEDIKPKPQK